jgi:heme/copper-type cytochrome/quinol oxidase subunit 4
VTPSPPEREQLTGERPPDDFWRTMAFGLAVILTVALFAVVTEQAVEYAIRSTHVCRVQR